MRYLKKLEIKLVRGNYPKIIKDKLRFPKEVHKTFKNLKGHSQEVLVGIYLNSDLKLTNYDILTIGSENQTIVPVKELFTHALIMRAEYIILIHNHPSGNIIPSFEDQKIISILQDYSQLLQICFLDFIIIGDKGKKKSYWSYFEEENGDEYSA